MANGNISKNDVDILRIGHSEIGGWELHKTHAGEYDQTFLNAWQDKPLRDFIRTQWRIGAAVREKRASIEKQVGDLTARVNQLSGQVTGLLRPLQTSSSRLTT